jgi:hypothetical protein
MAHRTPQTIRAPWTSHESPANPRGKDNTPPDPMARYANSVRRVDDKLSDAGMTPKAFKAAYPRKALWMPAVRHLIHPGDTNLRQLAKGRRSELKNARVNYGVENRKTWWNPMLESKSHIKVRRGDHVRTMLATRDLALVGTAMTAIYIAALGTGHAELANFPGDIKHGADTAVRTLRSIGATVMNASPAESTTSHIDITTMQFTAGQLVVQPTFEEANFTFDGGVTAMPFMPHVSTI